jgi:hypothetical protein
LSHLASWLPRYDYDEHHELPIAADVATVRRALVELDLGRIPFVRFLMSLRRLPARIFSSVNARELHAQSPGPRSGLMALGGFALLADEPLEVVLGVTGRFWKLAGEILPSDPASFRAPPPPGTARAAINFLLTPRPDGTTLASTETRILCADDRTRQIFGWYWRAIRLGSGATRIAMLRALRTSAEGTNRWPT